MRVLYAGDSPVGGPANYLLGILRFLGANFVHLPPSRVLSPTLLKKQFNAIILSDFSRDHAPAVSQKLIGRQVKEGTGLLMIGGWGSFSGPYGKWHGSLVEGLLPVSCLNRDDRLNLPGGAWMVEKKKHSMFRGISFKNPPVICGLNQFRPRKNSRVLLQAERIVDGKKFPLLVIDLNPEKRIAALATDLAPHWCGGLVDWGRRRVELKVSSQFGVEVGNLYLEFVSSLIKWVSGRFPRLEYATIPPVERYGS